MNDQHSDRVGIGIITTCHNPPLSTSQSLEFESVMRCRALLGTAARYQIHLKMKSEEVSNPWPQDRKAIRPFDTKPLKREWTRSSGCSRMDEGTENDFLWCFLLWNGDGMMHFVIVVDLDKIHLLSDDTSAHFARKRLEKILVRGNSRANDCTVVNV